LSAQLLYENKINQSEKKQLKTNALVA